MLPLVHCLQLVVHVAVGHLHGMQRSWLGHGGANRDPCDCFAEVCSRPRGCPVGWQGYVRGGGRGVCVGPGDPQGLSVVERVRRLEAEPEVESVADSEVDTAAVAVVVVAGVLVPAVEVVLVAEDVVVRVVVLLEYSLVA